MKVFRFNTANGRLVSFVSRMETLADGGNEPDCVYFAEDGSPLRLDQGLDGERVLRPWASCSSCRLAQILPYVRAGAGSVGEDTLEMLRRQFGAEADLA